MKVKCLGCAKKFYVLPEIFANYEIVFCPICGLDHQVIKKTNHTTVIPVTMNNAHNIHSSVIHISLPNA
ncbi:MAG TPA: hypothetical protein VLU95_00375 [Candidatus Acidoferrum sp.]|nr:hypothetical protein [Candidatus Acidoferrum sp.]